MSTWHPSSRFSSLLMLPLHSHLCELRLDRTTVYKTIVLRSITMQVYDSSPEEVRHAGITLMKYRKAAIQQLMTAGCRLAWYICQCKC